MHTSKIQNGFSLIELLIAVAIIGILSMVAIPSYQEYAMRGYIPDATSNLAIKRVQMEQFFQNNRTYIDGPACAADTTISKNYFNFSCSNVTTNTYTLNATGKGSMIGFSYTVDQQNLKATTAAPNGWGTNSNCWVTKKDGSCS